MQGTTTPSSTVDAGPPPPPSRDHDKAPFAARLSAGAMSGVAATTIVGLLLGMLGLFSIWLLAPLAAIVGFGLHRMWPTSGSASPAGSAVWAAALLVAVLSTATNMAQPSEQLIGGRDGGTYMLTAAWLAQDGALLIDARQGPFGESPDLDFGGPGFFDSRDDGRLNPQFLHGLPVLMAAGGEVGGDWLLMRVNALLGGLALMLVFAFAQLLVRPWLAFLVQATLAANLVFAFYARAPFAEILAMIFVFGGLWALWSAWEAESPRGVILAGVFIGGSFLARLDALVLLIPLVMFLAYEQRKAGGRSRLVRGFWRGMLPMLLLALGDLILVTPQYLANHRKVVLPIFAAVVAVVLIDELFGRGISTAVGRLSPEAFVRVAWAGAAIVALGMFFAYVVRPLVQVVGGGAYLTLIMTEDELAAGESRLFSEQSARWLGWYLGPVTVLFGSLGWAMLSRRVLGGTRRLTLPFLLSFSAITVLYLWRPSVNPDHIWAMRRFLPIVIPGFLIVAAVLLDEGWSAAHRWRKTALAKGGMAVAATAVFVGSLVPFAPLADLHEFAGLADDVRDGCRLMGDDAAVLFVDPSHGSGGGRVAPTYRGFCGFPAASTANNDRAFIAGLQAAWDAEGRQLWLLALEPSVLQDLGAEPVQEVIVGSYEILELTFTRRPDAVADFEIEIYAGRAPSIRE